MKNKRFPVLCSWCLEKGIETVIRYVPFKRSHGICPDCASELIDNPDLEINDDYVQTEVEAIRRQDERGEFG